MKRLRNWRDEVGSRRRSMTAVLVTPGAAARGTGASRSTSRCGSATRAERDRASAPNGHVSAPNGSVSALSSRANVSRTSTSRGRTRSSARSGHRPSNGSRHLVSAKAPRADAALYWRAYSLDKLNRQSGGAHVGRRTAQGLSLQPMAGRRACARDPGAAACGSAGVARGPGRRGAEAVRDSGAPAPGPGSGHPDAREAAAGHQLAASQGARAVRAGAEQCPARTPAADHRRSRRIQPGSAAEGHPATSA